MSESYGHRTTDPTRVRTAAHRGHDSEMADRDYARQQSAGQRSYTVAEEDRLAPRAVASVQEALRRSLIVPEAVLIPCARHSAAVGHLCWDTGVVRGICGERSRAVLAARAQRNLVRS